MVHKEGNRVVGTTLQWVEFVRVAYMLGLINEMGVDTPTEKMLHDRLEDLKRRGVVKQEKTRDAYTFDFKSIPPASERKTITVSFDQLPQEK